jgi:hypothetical protein
MPYVFNPITGGLDYTSEQTNSFATIEVSDGIVVNNTQIIGPNLVMSGVTIDDGQF